MSVDVLTEDLDGSRSSADGILDMARAGARLAALGEALLFTAAGGLAILRDSEAAAELRQLRVSGRRQLWDEYDARLWAADELAAALSISSAAAGRRLDDGERLLRHLPRVLAALADGDVDAVRVRALLDETERLDAETAAEVCDTVLAGTGAMTVGQVRRAARREAMRRTPQDADEQFRAALTRRRAVTFADETPGMACLQVRGPADQVAAAWQAATALGQWRVDQAGPTDAGSLTLDQARADAVLDLIVGLGTDTGAAGVAPVTVSVIVPPEAPAELVGHGPLPSAATPRPGDPAVAAVRAWHTDVTGVVTATGSAKGYVPSPRFAATVRARDLTCRFPGCTRRAERCDLDHVTPGRRAGRRPTTSRPCAAATTGSRPIPGGGSGPDPAASSNGPHPRATATRPTHRRGCPGQGLRRRSESPYPP